MHTRALHFFSNVFFRKRSVQKILFSLVILLPWNGSAGLPIAHDTTGTNTFSFTSEIYYVDEDATNAIITVDFSPGDRSWSGSVSYSVSNGTAIAGQDYTAVSGTLFFSGPGTPVPRIIIPIHKDNIREDDETVHLFLFNTNAIITRSNATLVIVDKPRLGIARSNSAIVLSWDAAYSDFNLEKSALLSGTNWSEVLSPKGSNNGSYFVNEPILNGPAFYRLKRVASPLSKNQR